MPSRLPNPRRRRQQTVARNGESDDYAGSRTQTGGLESGGGSRIVREGLKSVPAEGRGETVPGRSR